MVHYSFATGMLLSFIGCTISRTLYGWTPQRFTWILMFYDALYKQICLQMYHVICKQSSRHLTAWDRSGLLHPDAEYWCIKRGRALWCIIRPWPLPPVWLMTWHITPYSHHFSLSPLLYSSVPLTSGIMLHQHTTNTSLHMVFYLLVVLMLLCNLLHLFLVTNDHSHTPQMFLPRVHAPQKNQAGTWRNSSKPCPSFPNSIEDV